MQYIRYCGVDKREISSYNMSGVQCKCHKQSVRVFCVDCDDYVPYSTWNLHAKDFPSHKRRMFSDVVPPVQIFDLNSEADEPVLIIPQTNNKTVFKFMDTLIERGYTRDYARRKWQAISADEKDAFFQNPDTWAIPEDESREPPIRNKGGSAYHEYIRSMMAPGVKLVDIASGWRNLSTHEKEEFSRKADKRLQESAPRSTPKKRGRTGYQEFCTTCKGMDTSEISKAWKELSAKKKQKFAEKAKSTTRPHCEDENISEHSEEEVANVTSRRERSKRHTGYSEYLLANIGKSEEEVSQAWSMMSKEEKDLYFDIAREKARAVLKRVRKTDLEESEDSDCMESDKDCASQNTTENLSTLEESMIKLSSLVRASKQGFLTQTQFEVLQNVIIGRDHYLRSTVLFLASLLEENMSSREGIERWKALGEPVVNNVLLLYK